MPESACVSVCVFVVFVILQRNYINKVKWNLE
jgi:hypothetical protein